MIILLPTRWKSLRDRFYKESNKKASSGSCEGKEVPWGRLLFLKEHVLPRKTSSNYNISTEEDICSTEIYNPCQDYKSVKPSTSTPSLKESRPSSRKRKNAPQNAIADRFSSFLINIENIIEKRFSKSAKKDYGFLQFLSSKLDRLPERN